MKSDAAPDGRRAANVVIGANDPATLVGMRMALESDGLTVVAEVHSVDELLAAVDAVAPDVCLVDVDLSGGGIRGAGEVAARAPHVAVVLLADDEGDDRFLDAIRVGANGYVPKKIVPARLPNVIRAVLDGEPAIPRALVTLLINHYRARPLRRQLAMSNGRGVDLTSREWEVLDFMREGLSTRAIADRLMISEVTVRRHIGSVLKKLQVSSRADALRLLESA
jgi:two-component system, NarL family, nitrate/nitrite response regulator NarL